MQNVVFIETLEEAKATVLIVGSQAVFEQVDRALKGALRYNQERFSLPVSVTTNGSYFIPKVVIAARDFASLATEERVCFALDAPCMAKAAFDILLEEPRSQNLAFLCKNARQEREAFVYYRTLLEGISKAKKMIEAPANRLPPARFASMCQELEAQGVKVQVFDEKGLAEIGASALLAVGKGSCNGPRLVVMEWKGVEEDPIVLVGKGICFDAGGIHLKQNHLNEMKWDKAGGGAVFGVLDVVSRLQLARHVVGIIPLAENMPDGAALKPGDVIDTLGGKTVEIVDTDCEGRLVLADALSYGQKMFNPQALIDLGTLTLETFGALANVYGGLFCADPALSNRLLQAGEKAQERLWPLPLGEAFAKQLRSRYADLKNAGCERYGGSSVAAEFLRAFVSPEIPWAHIDISGVAWKIDAPEEGVSGFGVALLVEYLRSL